ncbi:MAG: GNAT family N-acetyltransferase [Methanomicrobiaceae archaeon]|nr:GNAT family N-acetyltransferase [Methanomicrobiaceae archaeon]
MFSKILLPTDFSPYADRTVACIGDMRIPGDIILLHVHTPHASLSSLLSGKSAASEYQEAEALLEKQTLYLESRGKTVKKRVERADRDRTGRTILAVAREEEPSLIAMGERGRGFIEGLLLGSVSTDVLRKAVTDVLIMKYGRSDETELTPFTEHLCTKVLCPVDFSRPSAEAVTVAASLPGIEHLILLHIISSAENREELRLRISHAEETLHTLERELKKTVPTVQLIIRFGNPADEIADVAEDEDVSLIFLARYGKQDYTTNVPIGSTAAEIAQSVRRPVWVMFPRIILCIDVRELDRDEFPLVEEIWEHYHSQKTDPATDRIFGVFIEDTLSAVARCRRHPDGLEVDGVFVPEEFRDRGYARKAVLALVEACGSEVLYMHSTLELVAFYRTFGFVPIPESELPPTIRDRFAFSLGELEGSNVRPMKRMP